METEVGELERWRAHMSITSSGHPEIFISCRLAIRTHAAVLRVAEKSLRRPDFPAEHPEKTLLFPHACENTKTPLLPQCVCEVKSAAKFANMSYNDLRF
eukprot:1348446-Pleurochrysis_carterae.AAC.3